MRRFVTFFVAAVAAAFALLPFQTAGQILPESNAAVGGDDPIDPDDQVWPGAGPDYGPIDPEVLESLEGTLLDIALYRRSQRMSRVDRFVERVANNELPNLGLLPGGEGAQGPCISNCVVYEVEPVVGPDGQRSWFPRALSALEVAELTGASPGADFLQLYSFGLESVQVLINESTGGPDVADVQDDLEDPDSDWLEANQPWINPHMMFVAGADMISDGATGIQQAQDSLATSAQQAQAEADDLRAVASRATDVGVATMSDGRQARAFTASDLNMPMGAAGEGLRAVMETATAFVDENDAVIVGHRVEGRLEESNGESRPFSVEVLNSDYRQVPSCDLYEPFRREVRISGMLDDEQMAEMEEASEQIAEFEAELAAMPPAQRQMMESMMGSQMDMMRNMANGGVIEHTQEIEEIICNPDLAALFAVPGVTNVGELVNPVELLARIQMDLATLGYQPGNTNGVLDTLTQVAISQYEAERGMPVTGEPSGALAATLAREVAGGG